MNRLPQRIIEPTVLADDVHAYLTPSQGVRPKNSTGDDRPMGGLCRLCRRERGRPHQIWKSRIASPRSDLGRRSRYFNFGGSALTWFRRGTLVVMNTLPPMTAPLPITVLPPRMVAPA